MKDEVGFVCLFLFKFSVRFQQLLISKKSSSVDGELMFWKERYSAMSGRGKDLSDLVWIFYQIKCIIILVWMLAQATSFISQQSIEHGTHFFFSLDRLDTRHLSSLICTSFYFSFTFSCQYLMSVSVSHVIIIISCQCCISSQCQALVSRIRISSISRNCMCF